MLNALELPGLDIPPVPPLSLVFPFEPFPAIELVLPLFPVPGLCSDICAGD